MTLFFLSKGKGAPSFLFFPTVLGTTLCCWCVKILLFTQILSLCFCCCFYNREYDFRAWQVILSVVELNRVCDKKAISRTCTFSLKTEKPLLSVLDNSFQIWKC